MTVNVELSPRGWQYVMLGTSDLLVSHLAIGSSG
jgi:hypothetical protein